MAFGAIFDPARLMGGELSSSMNLYGFLEAMWVAATSKGWVVSNTVFLIFLFQKMHILRWPSFLLGFWDGLAPATS